MTIVIHNNMLYGMTGGQTSGLTPKGFRTTTAREGNPFTAHDICALTHIAGAAFSSRILGLGDYSDRLVEAFLVKGCAVIEVMELCPSYGVKLNPKRKLSEIMESMGQREGTKRNDRPEFLYSRSPGSTDLSGKLPAVSMKRRGGLQCRYSIVVTGSAGEGVQVAGSVLSRAALSSGYHVTQKGLYPVTVGVGFSTTEINIAPFEINYNGIQNPDAVLVTSRDGLQHTLKCIRRMTSGLLFIDASLDVPETGADVTVRDFRAAGGTNAALYSILALVSATGIMPVDAIGEAITSLGLDDQIPFSELVERLNN
jgi:Pyruvate/2-oxoacid:ferredoxin oxidoreductase gamma subunit